MSAASSTCWRPATAESREHIVANGLLLAVCLRLNVSPREVRTSRLRRHRHVTRARHEWWTALYASGFSYSGIARLTGFDHSTVMYAVRAELAR